MSEQHNPVIFDLGSSTLRAGFAGHDQPKFNESSFLYRRADGSLDMVPVRFLKKPFVDMEVQRAQWFDPDSQAWVMDQGCMAKLAEMMLYSPRGLDCTAMDRPVFATCPSGVSSAYKKLYYEYFMEVAQVPAFFMGDSSTLSVYAAGRTSGLCVDIGASATSISRIDRGEVSQSTTYGFGGDNMDAFILSKVEGIDGPNTEVRLALAREVKHNACKCSHHALAPAPITPGGARSTRGSSRRGGSGPPTSPSGGIMFKLPDGSEVDISQVNEYAAETVFTNQMESGFPGLTEAVSRQVDSPDDFILLTGGSAHFQGLHTRLVNELQVSVFPFTQWTHRVYSSFIGASILSSLSSFSSLWITAESYAESGIDRFLGPN